MNMPKFISELAEKFENAPKECIVGAKAFTISFLLAVLGFIIAVSFSKAIGKPIVFICIFLLILWWKYNEHHRICPLRALCRLWAMKFERQLSR
jgi:hypothetical protein